MLLATAVGVSAVDVAYKTPLLADTAEGQSGRRLPGKKSAV